MPVKFRSIRTVFQNIQQLGSFAGFSFLSERFNFNVIFGTFRPRFFPDGFIKAIFAVFFVSFLFVLPRLTRNAINYAQPCSTQRKADYNLRR